MLDPSHFIPGTVLWLPKQKDINDFNRLDPHNTVPDKCFGHSALVLAEEKPTNCIIILILTSFGGGENIHHRVRNRGHRLGDYVPIHPAPRLVEVTPSLRLSASQEFVKRIWANVLQPRRCPRAWLQATWPQIWKWNERGRRIEPSSLHSLALYATQRGYDPVVYREMLERYAALMTPLCPRPEPVCVNIPEESYASTPTAIVMPPNVSHDTFSLLRSEPNDRPWRIPPEFEPLLPLTHRHSHPTIYPHRPAGASWAGSRGRGLCVVDSLVRLLKVLLLLGVIIGLPWVGYIAATWLATA